MKKNILIVCALWVELKAIKSEIKKLSFKDLSFSFFNCSVWNYETIYSLSSELSKNKYDLIVNIWICWVVNNSLPKELFQVYRIKNLSNNREVITPIYSQMLDLKSILSSEKIITSEEDMLWEDYVDMESYWIDFICNKYKIPYLIFKLPFDIVSDNSKKVSLKEIQNSLSNINFKEIFGKINKYLSENKSDDTWEKQKLDFYKNHFNFSFAENLIFIKNYNKFLALWYDFENFFEKNKYLDKKEFLDKAKKYSLS